MKLMLSGCGCLVVGSGILAALALFWVLGFLVMLISPNV